MNGINFVEWFFLHIFMQTGRKNYAEVIHFTQRMVIQKEIKAEFLPRNKNLFTPGFTSLSKWL